MKKIVYSGTFDPMTLGHQDLVARGLKMFDKVIIGVATAYGKKTMFSINERVNIIQDLYHNNPDVSVVQFDGLLVDFVEENNACAILRGVRTVSDFEYEMQMAGMNRYLSKKAETVFLRPSDRFTFLSSTMIRSISEIEPSRVSSMLDPKVFKKLEQKLGIQ